MSANPYEEIRNLLGSCTERMDAGRVEMAPGLDDRAQGQFRNLAHVRIVRAP